LNRQQRWQAGAKPPMVVMRSIFNKELETKERIALNKFTMGVAQPADYELFLDMTNMLIVAGTSADERKYARDYAETTALPAIQSIKARYDKTGKLGLTAHERKVLINLIEFSYQFWARNPIDLFHQCGRELKAYYNELYAKRREAAEGAEVEPTLC
jgi:hypothetical protein